MRDGHDSDTDATPCKLAYLVLGPDDQLETYRIERHRFNAAEIVEAGSTGAPLAAQDLAMAVRPFNRLRKLLTNGTSAFESPPIPI
jgi:hypothetical protein